MNLSNAFMAKVRALGFAASLLFVCLALMLMYPDTGLSVIFLLLIIARARRAWRLDAPAASDESCIQHADPEQCLQMRP